MGPLPVYCYSAAESELRPQRVPAIDCQDALRQLRGALCSTGPVVRPCLTAASHRRVLLAGWVRGLG